MIVEFESEGANIQKDYDVYDINLAKTISKSLITPLLTPIEVHKRVLLNMENFFKNDCS